MRGQATAPRNRAGTALLPVLSVLYQGIVKGLRDAGYGLRGFVMADPDGNRIDVGQRLPA